MDLLLTDFSYGLSSYGFFLTQYEAQRNPSDQRIVTAAMATMAAIWKRVSASMYLKWWALEVNLGGVAANTKPSEWDVGGKESREEAS